jgi:DNA-binding NarL/FixJ family response regulator
MPAPMVGHARERDPALQTSEERIQMPAPLTEPSTLSAEVPARARQRDGRPTGPKRLLVVDDHPAVRAGLRDMLNDEADFEVVAVTATAEQGVELAERERIDVAVVDYQLRGRNGLWLSRKLKRLAEPPAVVIYSAYADGVLRAAAVVAQADAIVSKGELGHELCEAIRRAASGEPRLPALPSWLAETLRRRLDSEQQAIFGMLLAGIAPAEAAYVLGLSRAALESQLWQMLQQIEALPASSRGR